MSYKKHHIKNKLRQIKPKKKFYKRGIFRAFIFFLILFFTSVYFFLFYPKIQINNIKISGNEKAQAEQIKKIAFTQLNVYSKSIFLADLNKISSEILKEIPAVENVLARKEFPQTIALDIKERKPIGIYCSLEDCFYIDKSGVKFEAVSGAPDGFSVLRGDKISKETAEVFFKIAKNLKDNFQIDIKEAFIASPFNLDIRTTENWSAYFNLSSDIDLQILKLNSLLKNELSQDLRNNLKYIDLRFKDKAYYR